MSKIEIIKNKIKYSITGPTNYKKKRVIYISNEDEGLMMVSEERFFDLIDKFFKKAV